VRKKKRNINHLTVHSEKKNTSLLWLENDTNDPNQANDGKKKKRIHLFIFYSDFFLNKQKKWIKIIIWYGQIFSFMYSERKKRRKKKCWLLPVHYSVSFFLIKNRKKSTYINRTMFCNIHLFYFIQLKKKKKRKRKNIVLRWTCKWMMSKPIRIRSSMKIHSKCMSKNINKILIFTWWNTWWRMITTSIMIIFRSITIIYPIHYCSNRPNISFVCIMRCSIVWN